MNKQLIRNYNALFILLPVIIYLGLAGMKTGLAQTPVKFRNYELEEEIARLRNLFHSLEEDEYGFIWAASLNGGGICRYDGYEFTYFTRHAESRHSLTNNWVKYLASFGDGRLYIGTAVDLNVYHLKQDSFSNLFNPSAAPKQYGTDVEPIIKDNNGIVWMGTNYGLRNFLPTTEEERFFLDGGHWVDNFIMSLIKDRLNSNLLWLGGWAGLKSFDTQKECFDYYPVSTPDGIPPLTHIFGMFQDQEGWIWCGSHNEMLYAFQPATKKWKYYKIEVIEQEKRNQHQIIYAVLPGAVEEQLWITTHAGVGTFNKTTGDFHFYYHQPSDSSSLIKGGFHRDALFDRHGRIWVGGLQGISRSIQPVKEPHQLSRRVEAFITDLKVNRQPYPLDCSILFLDELKLAYNQNTLDLKFALPNPLEPQKVEYAYRLLGHNREWTSGNSRLAHFEKLKGGHYTFQVKAREPGSEWTPVKELQFLIDTIFYQTWWFRLLVSSSIVLFLTGAFLWRIRQIRREGVLKRDFQTALAKMEIKALRSQMNPHFLFNSLNSIHSLIIRNDQEKASLYLDKFSRLVNLIIRNSDQTFVPLAEDLEALELYVEFEKIRFDRRFDYSIKVVAGVDVNKVMVPPLIIQPYVENAIRHGLRYKREKGSLWIRYFQRDGQLVCEVEDNGVGRKRAAELTAARPAYQKSLGMQITSDRLSYLNELYGMESRVKIIDLLDQKVAAGTKVIINFPEVKSDSYEALS